MAFQFTAGRFKAFDDNGTPLAGGRLYTLASGTTTFKAAYTDATLGTACTYVNDGTGALYIALDARGEAQLWLGAGAYSFALKDSSGAGVWTVDGVRDQADTAKDYTDSLRADLADTTDPTKGAGMIGMGVDQPYPTATVGNELKPRANWGSTYLQTLSDIQNGDAVSLWRFIDAAKHAGIRAATNSDDLTADVQDALGSGAYQLFVPFGTYNFDSELVIVANGTRLVGSGAERTKFIQRTAGASCITSDTAIARLLWCEVSNLRIEMPGGSAGHGIHIRNPEVFKGDQLRVTTLSGTKTTGYGVWIERESVADFGYYTRLTHSHIDKCLTGVMIEGQNPGGANGHWCEAVISNNNTNYGIHFKNNSGSYILNCAAEENLHNVYLEGGFGNQVKSTRLERPKTHNVYIASGEGHLVADCLLASAGFVNTATGRAVYHAAGQFNQISNNTIQDGFSSFDIEIVAGSLQTVLLDNDARTAASGWDVGGPRVLDNGTRTIRRSLVNTALNTYIHHASDSRFDSGKLVIGAAQTRLYGGTGSPEAVVTADRGSMYLREDGGAGTTLYIKESGTGNTGWIAK